MSMPVGFKHSAETRARVSAAHKQPGNWPQKVETFRRETGKTLVMVFQRELSSLRYEVGESDVKNS